MKKQKLDFLESAEEFEKYVEKILLESLDETLVRINKDIEDELLNGDGTEKPRRSIKVKKQEAK